MNMKVEIEDINEVYIKVKADPAVSFELRDHFTFEVPGAKYNPKVRYGVWDGKIRLYHSGSGRIYRGLYKKIEEFCRDRDYDINYTPTLRDFSSVQAKEFIESVNLPSHIEPRDYQINSFIDAIRNKRLLLLSPTASGKSLIIYLITRYCINSKVLIVVPTTSLVEQLYKDFIEYGWKECPDKVHRIYAGADKDTTKSVTISTWQSLFKLDKAYFHQFGTIIGDEAHLFKAKSLNHIMESSINAGYRIGTTGTLDGSKTNSMVLEGLFGPVKKIVTTKELMDSGFVSSLNIKCLLLKHPKEECDRAKKLDYKGEIDLLISSPKRNAFIRNLALSLKGNTLVLYNYVNGHGKPLHELIKARINTDRKLFFIHGGIDAMDREEIRGIVEKEKDAIIVASYGTFSTGINIKNLNNIIFASPSKSRIRNLQSIGRGLRLGSDKSSATLYDIADDLKSTRKKDNITLGHFFDRIKLYSEEKFRFKIYKIELE